VSLIPLSRRELLGAGCALAGSGGTGCAILRGGASHPLLRRAAANGVLRLERSALSGDGPLEVAPGGSLPNLLLVRRSGGQWAAVAADCTHRGCTIDWSPSADEWQCPCHGSRFAPDGPVREGPATDALRRFAVTEEGDAIVIAF
jgi:Rieske Fe-S protein